jgi:hypothetical protein
MNNTKRVSKTRMIAAAALATIGLSLATAPVASAAPWVPWSGPLHPVRHYAADALRPFWAIRHPLRAIIP